MSSFEFEPTSRQLTVGADFDEMEAREKARVAFLANLYAPGVTNPGDVALSSGEKVDFKIARDASPAAMQLVCKAAGIQVDLRT